MEEHMHNPWTPVHLELLYCPFGSENGFSNPFSSGKFSMTSLEKALKSEVNGNEDTGSDGISTHRKRDVIVRGVLSVTVQSAEDLPAMDLMGNADPYVVVQMRKTGTKNKTRVVNDSLNPAWNQTFDFVVEDGLHDMLVLEVYDHDTFGKGTRLGGKVPRHGSGAGPPYWGPKRHPKAAPWGGLDPMRSVPSLCKLKLPFQGLGPLKPCKGAAGLHGKMYYNIDEGHHGRGANRQFPLRGLKVWKIYCCLLIMKLLYGEKW
ncbi:hypothetical protein Taro_040884 [Colocasia esculenta]|uniref:C2 domain-containing protein n=1 Tax=Colocasia esculenta TaxID=4460 RepID=A0A843WK48_COLES|nr:hypothetical protein [Colocasia esculenta]